jgi:hypothetical protein
MFEKYMIFPLTADGDIYALHDTEGNQIAMGTREVCQTLLYLVTHSQLLNRPPQYWAQVAPRQRGGLEGHSPVTGRGSTQASRRT